jgi:hypothetical protein
MFRKRPRKHKKHSFEGKTINFEPENSTHESLSSPQWPQQVFRKEFSRLWSYAQF